MKRSIVLGSLIAALFVLVPRAPSLLAAPSSDASAQTTLTIKGMTCGGCVATVRLKLKKTAGVTAYDVSLERGEADVTYDPRKTDPKKIAESVSKTGFETGVKDTEKVAGNSSAQSSRGASLERTSVFSVVLGCKAAPELVCGGRTKPVLIELERDAAIDEAWLNTSGTALLVIGTESSTKASRAAAVRVAVGKLGKQVKEIEGEAREKVLEGFRSGSGWYRGEGMDEISRRIAATVAARLTRRTTEKSPLGAAKAAELEAALSAALQVSFVQDPEGDPTADLLEIAGAHLDKAGWAAFKEAMADGLNPKPGEK